MKIQLIKTANGEYTIAVGGQSDGRVACPSCEKTRLVARVECGPTHNVYECVKCQRSFARRRVP